VVQLFWGKMWHPNEGDVAAQFLAMWHRIARSVLLLTLAAKPASKPAAKPASCLPS